MRYNVDMTDDQPSDHKTEPQRKKEEAAKRLQEALARKLQVKPNEQSHQHGQKNFSPHFTPKPQRRGPRGS